MQLQVTEDYGLVAIDDKAITYMYRKNAGDILQCEVKEVRNYKFLQKYFSLIRTMFDQQEHFDQKDHFRKWIQMKAGYYTTIVAPNGNVIFQSDSISFDEMTEECFAKLYSQVIDVFLKELGTGQSEDEIMRVIGYA